MLKRKNVPGSFVVALSVLESLCISSYSLKVGIKYPKNVISELTEQIKETGTRQERMLFP